MKALLAAALLLQGPAPDSLHVFTLEPLDSGVYAAVVVDRPEAWAFANSLVVVGEDGVLVVDTQQSPAAARELIRLIRGLTSLPVRWVVNTHWHGDHVYGNVAYRDAYPGVRFLAHPATVEAMRDAGARRHAADLEALPEGIALRESWLEAGALPDGRALEGALREALERDLTLRRAHLREMRTLEIVEPEGVVDAPRVVDVGGRSVELIPLGPAHTEGDLVVRVADAGVVAAGDLMEEAPPWIEGAASLAGWADALDALMALGAGTVLPAHGGLQRDGRLLEGTRSLFRDLVAGARRAVAEGWTTDEAVERITLEPYRHVLRGVGASDEAFDAWRQDAVRRAVAEERGKRRDQPGASIPPQTTMAFRSRMRVSGGGEGVTHVVIATCVPGNAGASSAATGQGICGCAAAQPWESERLPVTAR